MRIVQDKVSAGYQRGSQYAKGAAERMRGSSKEKDATNERDHSDKSKAIEIYEHSPESTDKSKQPAFGINPVQTTLSQAPYDGQEPEYDGYIELKKQNKSIKDQSPSPTINDNSLSIGIADTVSRNINNTLPYQQSSLENQNLRGSMSPNSRAGQIGTMPTGVIITPSGEVVNGVLVGTTGNISPQQLTPASNDVNEQHIRQSLKQGHVGNRTINTQFNEYDNINPEGKSGQVVVSPTGEQYVREGSQRRINELMQKVGNPQSNQTLVESSATHVRNGTSDYVNQYQVDKAAKNVKQDSKYLNMNGQTQQLDSNGNPIQKYDSNGNLNHNGNSGALTFGNNSQVNNVTSSHYDNTQLSGNRGNTHNTKKVGGSMSHVDNFRHLDFKDNQEDELNKSGVITRPENMRFSVGKNYTANGDNSQPPIHGHNTSNMDAKYLADNTSDVTKNVNIIDQQKNSHRHKNTNDQSIQGLGPDTSRKSTKGIQGLDSGRQKSGYGQVGSDDGHFTKSSGDYRAKSGNKNYAMDHTYQRNNSKSPTEILPNTDLTKGGKQANQLRKSLKSQNVRGDQDAQFNSQGLNLVNQNRKSLIGQNEAGNNPALAGSAENPSQINSQAMNPNDVDLLGINSNDVNTQGMNFNSNDRNNTPQFKHGSHDTHSQSPNSKNDQLNSNQANDPLNNNKANENPDPSNDEDIIKEILDFWFHTGWDRETKLPKKVMQLWENPSQAQLQQLSANFKDELEQAGLAKREHWLDSKDGILAYIILTGSFARLIHQGNKKECQYDTQAAQASKRIILFASKFDQYTSYEKLFIIMPLINCENESDVNEGCKNLQLIGVQAQSQDTKEYLNKYYKVGQHMHLVIKKYGRYPDRNQLLGRENTPKEEKWLRRNGKLDKELQNK